MTLIQFFLKKQGLYNIFVNNVYLYYKRSYRNITYEEAVKKANNFTNLVSAFDWFDTNQGYRFWYEQEKMFMKLRKKYQKYIGYGYI